MSPYTTTHCTVILTFPSLTCTLYNRYSVPNNSGNGGKRELNKKDYRTQQMMLFRNLKQLHNDPLVRRVGVVAMIVELITCLYTNLKFTIL